MEQSKKKKYFFITGPFVIFISLIGLTYAFFNYTRTGQANTLGTGRIYFNTTQGESVTLTNIFPMTAIEAANANLDSVTVGITGDTTYTDGEEFLITIVDVENTVNNKEVPMNYIATYEAATGGTIGTNSNDYWNARNSKDATIYKLNATGSIEEDTQVLVGYIDNGATGISGILTISAYIDADRIAISDTYYGNVTAIPTPTAPNDQYGTTTEWVDGRTVFTTTEWNSLSSNPISFKIKAESNEGIWVHEFPTLYSQMIKNVDTSTIIDFGEISSSSNGQGLYILPGTTNDTNPIYYYRGAVTDNNVIFGDYCWQIVRTTDTGGIKMIYNGALAGTVEKPTCVRSGSVSRALPTLSSFNSNSGSVQYIGYMYNKRYTRGNNTYNGAIYGRSVEWDGTKYMVIDQIPNTPSTQTSKSSDYHYSCPGTGITSCENVRFYYYGNYYIILSGGETIEDALYKMTGNGSDVIKQRNSGYILNQTDSTIKVIIDDWFKINLTNEEDGSKTNYVDYLEDTVFCNDRSFKTIGGNNTYELSGWNPNGGSLSTSLYFGVNNRFNNNNWYSTINIPTIKNIGEVPNIECSNETDRFSVSSSVAHLKYPVGLLTIDEIIMAGESGNSFTGNNSYYLFTNSNYWSMSPYNFDITFASMLRINGVGSLSNYNISYTTGVRPVISLKSGIEYEKGGDGSPTNPYVIKYN